MEQGRKWYFWVPCLPALTGPYDSKANAQQEVRSKFSRYQQKRAVYKLLEPREED